MILVFCILSFRPAFSLSVFTLIKRLFSSLSLSIITVISAVYLRLLIFLSVILILACASSSLAFHKMCSALLNKQSDNIQPWHIPFPILNQSIVPCPVLSCCFLTCIQEAGKVAWYSHLFKNFPQFVVIHTVKGFSSLWSRLSGSQWSRNMFFWNCLAFSMIQWMLTIWPLVPLSFLNPTSKSQTGRL